MDEVSSNEKKMIEIFFFFLKKNFEKKNLENYLFE